ncbi:SDR family NAD(P)-dependent oxidoreductase [Arenibaculum sp.]|jgi:NAD(P)-dependent dehydrogenase (short-subunit alcohol dehydrogenase family)|uniref:SDR family NAD(P)-dependent oxidoreductase n=1 Tax=Arenibaculum sp. TaxID=2865862 RepID=UPI002E0EB125|nr:SDR family NAD(P)-dependent oxidoreductase [Arenibaculum sp.]
MSPVAWVTGAGSGIGAAVARRLAAQGWRVAISARTASDLDLLATGDEYLVPVPLDVTDAAAVHDAAGRIEATLGALDLAVFNAGTHQPMGAADFSADTARRLMEVNFMGVVHGLEAVLPRLRARRRGTVAVVASVAGYRGLPSAAAYAPTKAALISLCESLEPELRREGVALKLVNPGFVRTPLTDRNDFPMPFLIPADEAARRVVDGLRRPGFEIAFPRRFAYLLKLGRLLPNAVYLNLAGRLAKR